MINLTKFPTTMSPPFIIDGRATLVEGWQWCALCKICNLELLYGLQQASIHIGQEDKRILDMENSKEFKWDFWWHPCQSISSKRLLKHMRLLQTSHKGTWNLFLSLHDGLIVRVFKLLTSLIDRGCIYWMSAPFVMLACNAWTLYMLIAHWVRESSKISCFLSTRPKRFRPI